LPNKDGINSIMRNETASERQRLPMVWTVA